MIRNLMAFPCMLALVLACGQGRTNDQNTGAGSGTGAESGALPADTGYGGSGVDDTTAAPSVDTQDTTASRSGNQDQSGVTNTETGQSELGDDITKTTPDGGEPVTSKGDTVGTSGGAATSDTVQ